MRSSMRFLAQSKNHIIITVGNEATKLIVRGRPPHEAASMQVEQDWVWTGVIWLCISVHVQVQTVFYTAAVDES